MLQAAHASVPWIVTPDDHEVFGPAAISRKSMKKRHFEAEMI